MANVDILIVEDETPIREMLRMVLRQAGFEVQEAPDTCQASRQLSQKRPDLILLDWMLTGQSGIDWARRLRRDADFSDLPIILLTARGEEEDKIAGLDCADDYVTKPFSPRELIARINAVLRRFGKGEKPGILHIGGITLNPEEHQVKIDRRPVNLSPTEYRLLEFFLTHPDKVYSRTQLLDRVWGREAYIEERTVDVHIRRLRKILAEFGRDAMIQTVRGFGYRFTAQL
ncbi:two-component system, OmpR family, phosphate regulon response regulator PhoB [Methylomarinovum caldicuralii]|uniref:Phosphate regulon transcriptional regulatory protein PhoB n=1 Tax=Methylomarinovum caldicuralii TaxID=438856 RepID=A0AAU9CKW9_9GAMM|nr:phosphate regulon transcriptional regulator PhoB [Methylomarinovum caldicuralii]BCX80483.1 two-component system, OmpR family, phosphate regulon response regulator PhoB [Methylomarinovum caldicuralii]